MWSHKCGGRRTIMNDRERQEKHIIRILNCIDRVELNKTNTLNERVKAVSPKIAWIWTFMSMVSNKRRIDKVTDDRFLWIWMMFIKMPRMSGIVKEASLTTSCIHNVISSSVVHNPVVLCHFPPHMLKHLAYVALGFWFRFYTHSASESEHSSIHWLVLKAFRIIEFECCFHLLHFIVLPLCTYLCCKYFWKISTR